MFSALYQAGISEVSTIGEVSLNNSVLEIVQLALLGFQNRDVSHRVNDTAFADSFTVDDGRVSPELA
jgi:hypothetical protein